MGRRKALLASAAVLAPFLGLVAWHWGDGPGLTADDHAQYLMHAEALVEGRAYTDIPYLYNPRAAAIGPRAEPPGLPLTVAAVFAVVGRNLTIVRLVLLAFTVGFVVLAGHYFASHVDAGVGLGVALLVGLSPGVVNFSSRVFSDLPFCALVWGVIWLADTAGPWRPRHVLMLTLVGAGALAFRIAGVALLPALVLFAVLRFREHRLRPLIPVAVWAAVGAVAAVALHLTTTGIAVTLDDPLRLFRYVPSNIRTYRLSLAEALLYPFPWDSVNDGYHVMAALVMAIGLGAWLRRSYRSLAAVFSAVYVAMLVVLPVREPRYVWPLFPIMVFGMLNGIRLIAQVLRRAAAPAAAGRAALAAASVIAVLAVASPGSAERPASLPEHPDVLALFGYLRGEAETAPVRAVFFKPRVMAWEMAIPTMGPLMDSPAIVLEELDRFCINTVVLGDLGLAPKAEVAMRAAVSARSAAFALAFQNASFQVYRHTPPACGRGTHGPPVARPSSR